MVNGFNEEMEDCRQCHVCMMSAKRDLCNIAILVIDISSHLVAFLQGVASTLRAHGSLGSSKSRKIDVLT